MELTIGNKIKELRRARGMTQERLAELVGISFQAISKWECGIALPDITLIPKLAQIFGVTTDELFDYSSAEIEADVMSFAKRSWETRNTAPETARAALEEGLVKYPDNDILLENLLYVADDPDEIIKIVGKILDVTRQDDIKYDALRYLAEAYAAKGDLGSAAAALEKIPEIYFTKLEYMAFLLKGSAKRTAAEKQKGLSLESLIRMMWAIADCYESDGDIAAAVAELKSILALLDAFPEDDIRPFRRVYEDDINARISRLSTL